CAANVYLDTGKTEQRRSALDAAVRDAKALRPWETQLEPAGSLFSYFEQIGNGQELLATARRAATASDAPLIIYNYCLALYRSGQLAEALQQLERRRRQDVGGDFLRACLLAEIHPKDLGLARSACEEMAKRYTLGSSALIPQSVLLCL